MQEYDAWKKFLLISVFAGVPISSWADDVGGRNGIESITVTAQKREEKLQDIPLAVTAVTAEGLEKAGITQFSDIQQVAPSLTITQWPGSSAISTIFLRGIGQVNSAQLIRDPGVGTYIDDIYVGTSQGLSASLLDLERVEVLRGPQGSVYGRNTTGGAIKFVTQKPTGEWGFKQVADVASHGRYKSQTTVNFPEFADVSAKITYLRDGRDALVKNVGSGGGWGEYSDEGLRVALRWRPVQDLTFDYAFDYANHTGTNLYLQRVYQPAAPFGFSVPVFPNRLDAGWRGSNLPMADDYRQNNHALIGTWDISKALTLKTTTSYRVFKQHNFNDSEEAAGLPAWHNGAGRLKEFSQEVLAAGELEGLNVNYTVGAVYNRDTGSNGSYSIADSFVRLRTNPPGSLSPWREATFADPWSGYFSNFKNTSKAIYGQATWKPPVLEERLSLTIGARYTGDTRGNQRYLNSNLYPDGTYGSFIPFRGTFADGGTFKSTVFDPNGTIDYRWTDDLHTYFRYAESFRGGGWNNAGSVGDPPYRPEKLKAYEIGVKSDWLDHRLQFNADGFISKIHDVQFDAYDAAFQPHAANGGNATIKGVEVTVTIVPVEGLKLSGDYTYLHTRLDTVIFPFSVLGGSFKVGDPLQYAPKHKFNVSAEYSLPVASVGTLTAFANYSLTTATFGSSAIPGYDLLNARLTLGDIAIGNDAGKLAVSLYSNNLLNKSYLAYQVLGAGLFGEKRTVGLNLTYNY